jgi:hypothetical protein
MDLQTQEFLKSLLAKLVYYNLTAQDLLEFEKTLSEPESPKKSNKK